MPRRGEQVDGIEPELQRSPSILKQRVCRWMKMPTAPLARVRTRRPDPIPARRSLTVGAVVALTEAHVEQVVKARLIIGEPSEEVTYGDGHVNCSLRA